MSDGDMVTKGTLRISYFETLRCTCSHCKRVILLGKYALVVTDEDGSEHCLLEEARCEGCQNIVLTPVSGETFAQASLHKITICHAIQRGEEPILSAPLSY